MIFVVKSIGKRLAVHAEPGRIGICPPEITEETAPFYGRPATQPQVIRTPLKVNGIFEALRFISVTSLTD